MIRRFLYALRFLTILPLPYRRGESLEDVAGAVLFFPPVGALLGAFLAAAASASLFLWSPGAAAVVTTAAGAFITGALHLDGLADLADGLGGGKDKPSRLAIMKDSRIGGFGAVALILLLAGKGVFFYELFLGYPRFWTLLILLAVMGSVSRGGTVLLILIFPAARPDGLGQFFREKAGKGPLVAGMVLGVLPGYLLLGAGGFFLGLAVWALMVLGALGVFRLLGGLTGDVYGAFIEVSELVFLMILTALPADFFTPVLPGLGGLF